MPDTPLSSLERQANHDLRVKNHRITFTIVDSDGKTYDYHMVIKPESYTLDRPARVNVVQTRAGGFIDEFGLGFGTIVISGTTGWGQSPNNAPFFNSLSLLPTDSVDGFDRWRGLKNFFETFYRLVKTATPRRLQMQFHNWSEQEWFIVWPVGLPKLTRSVREPLLFRYDIQLTVLRKLNETSYQNDFNLDPLADIGVRHDRAPQIGLRMQDQLDNQAALVAAILNSQNLDQFDPANPGLGDFTDLTPPQMDQYTQMFIDDLIRRQAPPTYTPPTDSGLGVVARTRSIADRITDYANGTTSNINTTLGEVNATVRGWRDVLDAADYAVNLPVVYAREVKETLCSVQSLLLYPQLFVNSVSAALTNLADLLLDSGCATTLRR